MKRIASIILVLGLMAGLASCGDNEPSGPDTTSDNFDRSAFLMDVADHFIIPEYTQYVLDLTALDAAANTFATERTIDAMDDLRLSFKTAYLQWQRVAMYNIGKAEEVSILNYTNIYPTDVEAIEQSISQGGYNLALPSKMDEQGFPALDYLLYNGEIIDVVTSFSNADRPFAIDYLRDNTARMLSLASQVLDSWNEGYRETFIENNGSSATSSVNKLVNDYLFHYEKHLRAGKVAIPAGHFSGSPLVNTVEGFYSRDFSKQLFQSSFDAVREFFSGRSKHTDEITESLESYLVYLDQNDTDIAGRINAQFALAQSATDKVSDDFVQQITDDNMVMLELYQELQDNVIIMKVDMLQALNVKVDFVDADGD